MSTIVTVWDYNGGNYAMRIAEEFPLQEDFMRLPDGSYYYAVATCHTRDGESRVRMSDTFRKMFAAMGKGKTVQQVLIATDTEHVIFVNPRVELFQKYGDMFFEISSNTVKRSGVKKRRKSYG